MSCSRSQVYKNLASGAVALDTLSDVEVIELWGCLNQDEKGVIGGLLSRAAVGVGGLSYTDTTAAVTSEETTSAGTTGAGIFEYSIANIGSSVGTVAGVNFPAGASVTQRGYVDEVSKEVRRPASVAYDATGTTFLIFRLAYA